MFQFCVKATVGDGICLFEGSASAQQGLQSCQFQNLDGYSVASVTFRILPLELGLHTINFTLMTEQNSEVLVKTLRVVVRPKPSLELFLNRFSRNKWMVFYKYMKSEYEHDCI